MCPFHAHAWVGGRHRHELGQNLFGLFVEVLLGRQGLNLRDPLAAIRERGCRDDFHPVSHDGRTGGGGRFLERDGHLARGRVAVARVAGEPLHDDLVERRGEATHEVARRIDGAVKDVGEDGRLVVRVEEPLGRKNLPEHHRRCVDVGSPRPAMAVQDLG